MIKNLCPSHYSHLVATRLCALEDLLNIEEKPDLKNNLIKLLDRDGLGDAVGKGGREDHHDDASTLKIRSKEIGNKFVVITGYDSGPIVRIEFKFKDKKLIGISPLSIVTVDRNEVQIERQYHTAIKVHRSGKHIIYYYKPKNSSTVSTNVDYLDATAVSENGAIESEYFSDNGLEYSNETRNLRYKINFMGLLLFLFNLSTLVRKKKQAREYIYEVISNPEVLEMARFLRYWRDFEDAGFDVPKSLMEIAAELKNYLAEETAYITVTNMARLIRRATEAYFIRINRFFFWKIDEIGGFSYIYAQQKGSLKEIRRKANEYRLYVLKLLKAWYREDLNAIDELAAIYENS